MTQMALPRSILLSLMMLSIPTILQNFENSLHAGRVHPDDTVDMPTRQEKSLNALVEVSPLRPVASSCVLSICLPLHGRYIRSE